MASSPSLDSAPARVGPDHGGEALGLGLADDVAQVVQHVEGGVGAGVDGVADGGAAEADGIVHRAGDRLRRGFLAAVEGVGAVELEDQRDLRRIGIGHRLDHAEHRGVGVEAGVKGELGVIDGIVAGRVGPERPHRTVLETLVDRQDHQLAGTAEPTVGKQAGDVRLGAGVVAGVVGKDLLDPLGNPHLTDLPVAGVRKT